MRRHVEPDQALRWALSGGEDYELCFTVPELNRGTLDVALANLGAGYLYRPDYAEKRRIAVCAERFAGNARLERVRSLRIVLCGVYCRVAASPYPAYRYFEKPGTREAPPGFFI
ncbi:Thiamine-monophosphate kinase [Leclercia adecarboxylata]|uniref:Thiamine-monophosphate kinase n=1 Tax=Leclercia adecarboxylata TaxID=83655 RepID=A0A4V6YXV3_9ENTR|nr:Thiamine-monophosphate kinase [Leclercia adecarboxylata]